jgi:dTMP kinase
MFIAFTGTDGAGKSTQSVLLQQWLATQGYRVKVLDKWDIFDHSKFPECRFIHGQLPELRECIAEMEGPARALFLFWSIEITLKALKNNSDHDIYICDGYWMKHAASEIVYGNSTRLVDSLINELPPADITFHFKIDPSLAAKRKTEFTPYECGRDSTMTLPSFLTHQHKVRTLLDSWSESFQWQKIDAAADKDEIQTQLRRQVSALLPGDKT